MIGVEFDTSEMNPTVVVERVQEFLQGRAEEHVLNVYHDAQEFPRTLIQQYASLGYDLLYTSAVLAKQPEPARELETVVVQELRTEGQRMLVNLTHQDHQPVPDAVLGDPWIHPFFAVLDGQAVGWGLLVTNVDGVGYVSDMFTLPDYRGRGVATALLDRLESKALELGIGWVTLTPSFMAWSFYQRVGYAPVAWFTAFKSV
jgi:GNAT superfamily N-acetyltransferase